QGLRLDGADAVGKFQREQRSGSQVTFAGADAAGEVQLRNAELEVFTEIGSRADDVARQLEARVAALADDGSLRLGIDRLKRKVLAIDSDGGNLFDADARIDAQQSLGGGDAQFGRIRPAPHLARVEQMLEQRRSARSTQAAERLDRLDPGETGG